MFDGFMESFRLAREAGRHSVAMRHRLAAYWASLGLVLLAAFLVLASALGMFSRSEEQLQSVLHLHQDVEVAAIVDQVEILTAHGLTLAKQASDVLTATLGDTSVSQLNDDPDKIERFEKILYSPLVSTLRVAPCNGAYLILDATINTGAEKADTSRAGLYLRFANLSNESSIDQDITLYRGIADVARSNEVELHNRWRMEFDVSLVDGYADTVGQPAEGFAGHALWTDRRHLTDTWERIMLLSVPIEGADGLVAGICGVELSDLYFRLTHPVQTSEFGSIVTLLAPVENGQVLVSKGMTGSLEGTFLADTDVLAIEEGKCFNTYVGESGSFLGVHTRLNMETVDGLSMHAVTLVPKSHYAAAASADRITLIVVSLIFLAFAVGAAVFFSRRFVRPISESLALLQKDPQGKMRSTGISEVDDLIAFLHTRSERPSGASLPPDIEDLLEEFSGNAATLTATERTILSHYAEGCEVADIAQRMFISIHTVRKHNANIYKKLDIGSKEELVLYLELFRRCDRLDDILN